MGFDESLINELTIFASKLISLILLFISARFLSIYLKLTIDNYNAEFITSSKIWIFFGIIYLIYSVLNFNDTVIVQLIQAICFILVGISLLLAKILISRNLSDIETEEVVGIPKGDTGHWVGR